jgi:hypothetical protein
MQPWSQPLLWKGASGAVACDPYFGNVVLLMGYEGANGATGGPGMTDESPAAHGVASILTGTAQISNAASKFGSTSLRLSNGAIYFADSNDWNFGGGNFTVEMWVNLDAGASIVGLIGQWTTISLTNNGWFFNYQNPTLNWNVSTTGSNNLHDITATWGPTANTWYFVTIDYDGTKYRAYVNGVMTGSSTTTRTLFDSGHHLVIGGSDDNQDLLSGYIDELRITKGVARYASDSGFAVPTAAFPRTLCPAVARTAWNTADTSFNGFTNIGGTGNLSQLATGHGANCGARATNPLNAGKVYFEVVMNLPFSGQIGIARPDVDPALIIANPTTYAVVIVPATGTAYNYTGSSVFSFGAFSSGDTTCVAVDLTNKLAWFRRNGGNWNNDVLANQNPATGTGGINFSGWGIPYYWAFAGTGSNTENLVANFGATAFAQTMPSGFISWDQANGF